MNDKMIKKGGVYVDKWTMTDDHPHRFVPRKYVLRDVAIVVSTNTVLFGNESKQMYPRADTKELTFKFLDVSKLYFKNAAASANGVVDICGVVEEE